MRITPRLVFAAIFVAAACLIGFGLYLQEQEGLDPCPMCILQRYAFISLGLVALVGAIHGPKGLAARIYGGLVGLIAIAGGGVAVRHSWVQHFPPKVETCGADLDFIVSSFPLSKALPKIFQGTGSCSTVDWTMLGLSIPEWAFVWFAAFLAASAWVAFIRKPE